MSENSHEHPYGQKPAAAPHVIAPGWYPDPYIHNGLRYWDGAQWTTNVAAADAPGAAAQAAPPVMPGYAPAIGYGTPPLIAGTQPMAPAGVWTPTQTRGTDGFAIAAFICGLLGFLLFSIPLGIAGLVRTQRSTGRSGRGLAVAGMILSGLWLGGLITIGVIAEATDNDTQTPRSPVRSWTTPTPRASGPVNMAHLQVGQCIALPSSVPSGQSTLQVVPCSQFHNAEVFAVDRLPAGTYPGNDDTVELVEQRCAVALTAFAGTPSSKLDVFEIWPSRAAWGVDDRAYICVAVSDHRVTGTLAGTG